MEKLRLGVNIDHVATLRNARDGAHPDPVRAAELAKQAGADGITAHLREDRRHIRDADMPRLKAVGLPLNFEMAATKEMLALALELKPHACCLVPEKREEKTTEGGLNVAAQVLELSDYCAKLAAAGIRASLFIDADELQIRAAHEIGAPVIELHTGHYAELFSSPSKGEAGRGTPSANKAGLVPASPHPNPPLQGEGVLAELARIRAGAELAHSLGIEVHAGHGLTYENTPAIAAIAPLRELNIGHFLVGEAVFVGLAETIARMRAVMDGARA